MTAQIGDSYRFDGGDYTIVCYSRPISFDPTQYGITPEPCCSACWKGYWCGYAIKDDRIILEDLFIHSKDDVYPPIAGITAVTEEDAPHWYMGHHVYKGLDLPVDYTGKILAGDHFIRSYYIHRGHQRPWGYRTLKEFVFEKGILLEINDHSHIASAIRNSIYTDPSLRAAPFRPVSVEQRDFDEAGIHAWWLQDTYL